MGRKFDIREYLLQLQWSRNEKKKRKPPRHSKTRHCLYSQDPVKDDLVWKSVVRGEAIAAERRKRDYASAQQLYQHQQEQLSVTTSQEGREEEGEDDAPHELPQQATHDPPLPATSNGYIGWRSSVPHLQLERFGNFT
ncbi:uncharacterized protein LOC135114084 isoform X1 [Scylla paramamosain]|uniref:uncharacterized protein LOC135114084 isoform X1 n=1 Tax=Scylla paramamosain TaxID=85552 RepID=UPI00308374C5